MSRPLLYPRQHPRIKKEALKEIIEGEGEVDPDPEIENGDVQDLEKEEIITGKIEISGCNRNFCLDLCSNHSMASFFKFLSKSSFLDLLELELESDFWSLWPPQQP